MKIELNLREKTLTQAIDLLEQDIDEMGSTFDCDCTLLENEDDSTLYDLFFYTKDKDEIIIRGISTGYTEKREILDCGFFIIQRYLRMDNWNHDQK